MNKKSLTNSSSSGPWISPNCKVSNWLGLKLDTCSSKEWSNAVKIFEDRIKGRFLNPIEALENDKDDNIWELVGLLS